MIERGEPFYELDQMIGCQFTEDWRLDYETTNEAAEAWIMMNPDEARAALLPDIDGLFACTESTLQRKALLTTSHYAFRGDTDAFDVWLRAVRVRAVQALAGIHSEPMEGPRLT
jgi:hypothetical protein